MAGWRLVSLSLSLLVVRVGVPPSSSLLLLLLSLVVAVLVVVVISRQDHVQVTRWPPSVRRANLQHFLLCRVGIAAQDGWMDGVLPDPFLLWL